MTTKKVIKLDQPRKHAILAKDEDLQIPAVNKNILLRQGYRLVGHHSAVKICGWTKSMLKNEGGCYKFTFYGIRSHQCMQMTTSMYCASRCLFCWRGEKAPVAKKWYGTMDDPDAIIDSASEEHGKLLEGFKGNPKGNKVFVSQMERIKHVALSLTGEPITYPKMNEILHNFHKRRISTFLVTNAQYPDEIEHIDSVTQLYLSIDAPNKDLFKKVDRPLYPDYYDRMLRCLDILATRKYRTCIRLTVVKGMNMEDFPGYGDLINRGQPDFIEIKSYMWVGPSQQNLGHENMASSEEVKKFSEELLEHLPDYEYVSEHYASRVMLLMKKSWNKRRWINFPKFFEEANAGKVPVAEEYSEKKMCSNE
jgi:tRNA wybutosine-synthesizing protein 1